MANKHSKTMRPTHSEVFRGSNSCLNEYFKFNIALRTVKKKVYYVYRRMLLYMRALLTFRRIPRRIVGMHLVM